MSIRPYAPSDLDALRALCEEVVAAGRQFVFEDVEGVLAYWLGPTTRAWVAEAEGEGRFMENWVDTGP